MSRNFVQWFAFLIVCSVLAAYVAAHALPLGAPFRSVFRFVGLTVFIANSLALWPMSIWYSRGWKLTARATVDALIYGALAAAIFGALWPH